MRFHWLLPSVKGIPVLMYHRVWPGLNDGLTLTPEKLREQWSYLREEGYSPLSLEDFLAIARGEKPRPPKSLLLTFDDGYHNNLTYLYPLLQEFGWCATIFIITDTLDGTAKDESGDLLNRKLSVANLRSMDPRYIQLGLHGYHHENFSNTSPEDIRKLMEQSVKAFEDTGLGYRKVLAYPYGARPKDKKEFDGLKKWMSENGIEAAFRIGNRVSEIPVRDRFEIRRIDIRGTDSLEDFKIKLVKGKLKPF
ncbi:polysaccharide deacetylase family protein [Chitinophagaceae bacterium MMS25-I14]